MLIVRNRLKEVIMMNFSLGQPKTRDVRHLYQIITLLSRLTQIQMAAIIQCQCSLKAHMVQLTDRPKLRAQMTSNES